MALHFHTTGYAAILHLSVKIYPPIFYPHAILLWKNSVSEPILYAKVLHVPLASTCSHFISEQKQTAHVLASSSSMFHLAVAKCQISPSIIGKNTWTCIMWDALVSLLSYKVVSSNSLPQDICWLEWKKFVIMPYLKLKVSWLFL